MRLIFRKALKVTFIQNFKRETCHCPSLRKAEKTGQIRANLGLHERMTEKDRIRKQIKKQNAPELTEEQMVGKTEREVKRKHRKKLRSCWKKSWCITE